MSFLFGKPPKAMTLDPKSLFDPLPKPEPIQRSLAEEVPPE